MADDASTEQQQQQQQHQQHQQRLDPSPAISLNLIVILLQVAFTVLLSLLLHVFVRVGFPLAAMISSFFVWIFVAVMFIHCHMKPPSEPLAVSKYVTQV